jgi:hypothetical protein
LWQFYLSLFIFIDFSYHTWCLLFFIIFLKLEPRVDNCHVLGHKLGWITRVIEVNQIFYCAGSKNNIILIKKKQWQKQFNGCWHDFLLANHLIFYSVKNKNGIILIKK